jgi:hypothetical protein
MAAEKSASRRDSRWRIRQAVLGHRLKRDAEKCARFSAKFRSHDRIWVAVMILDGPAKIIAIENRRGLSASNRKVRDVPAQMRRSNAEMERHFRSSLSSAARWL